MDSRSVTALRNAMHYADELDATPAFAGEVTTA